MFGKIKIYSVLALSAIMFFFALSASAQSVSDRLVELTKKIEELEKKEQQLKSGISKTSEQAKSLANEIKVLNAQILRLETSIERTQNQIEVTTLSIQQVRQEIFDTEDVLVKKKRSITSLLREVNDIDNKSMAAVLLNSNDFSDFFNELEYVNNIGSSILVTLTELREAKEALLAQEQELSDQKIEAERLNIEYQNRQSALSGTAERKDQLLKDTKGKEEEYKKQLTEVEQERAKFFQELKQLEQNAKNEGIFIVDIKVPVPPKGNVFSWPEDDAVFTQGYGYTTYARRGAYGGAPHNGIDMASGQGTFIKAIGDGKVVAKGFNNGFGNWVAIQHGNGLVSLYAHMRSPSFVEGDSQVSVGDVIGYEGSTGNSTGSHLHLSLYNEFFTYINTKRDNQVYFNYFDGTLNPLDYLP